MRVLVLVLVGCVLVVSAAAHLVPVLPATCRFEPLRLEAPATGAMGEGAPATDADVFRILFDSSSSSASFCPTTTADPLRCSAPQPRAFELGGIAGALFLPSSFSARLQASGDLTATSVPLRVQVDGGDATIPVTLTTGVVAGEWGVREGAPIGGGGVFTLVGELPGDELPGALTGQAIVVRMTCALTPNPDLDQFAVPATVSKVAGALGSERSRLRFILKPGLAQSPSVSDHPFLLRVRVGPDTLTALTMRSGLAGRRRFQGDSDDGQAAIDIRQGKSGRLVVNIRFDALAVPPQTPRARQSVAVTAEVGGLLARGERLFRASRDGRQLRAQ